MQFTREINRLMIILLIAFGIIATAALYWAVIGPDTVLLREDNPRLVEAEARILRGGIYSHDGILLAESKPGETGTVTRQYIYPQFNSVLGYYSLRYGVGGAEAAYNSILRGDDLPNTFMDEVLHRPQTGSDIKLTFDLEIQQKLAGVMNGQTGAGVVLEVPSGRVLAIISLPTYDPNQLDAEWDQLSAAPGKPFFNRALQGNYQPGGTLETLLMAAALLDNQDFDTPLEHATQPIQIADIELQCAVRLGNQAITLREAYTFACPAPFADLARSLGTSTLQATFDTFQLNQPTILAGFTAETAITATPENRSFSSTNLIEEALGQGNLTVTPLEMAVLMASIVNDGNAPQPYTLLETRTSNDVEWLPATEVRPTLAFTTANTARQLQDMMRLTVAQGAAQNASRPNIDIGGHAALAYSGEETQAWFVGFVTLGGRQGVAIAVVLENSADTGLAADIGGEVLALAHGRLQNP